jgi:hypothetical protein
MGIKISRAFSCVLMMFIVLGIVPSFAFASENNHTENVTYGNVTSENFTVMKAMELDLLSKQISMLQSIYANVSNASNASELQQAMYTHMMMLSPNTQMCVNRMNIGAGFNLATVANVTDANFTDVQAGLLGSIQNMTAALRNQQNRSEANNNSNMTAQLGDRIANLQNLSDQVNSTTNATELQGVVLTFAQTQLTNSIGMKITTLQQIENNMSANDTNTTMLDNKIANLTALEGNINNTTSIGGLMALMSSFHPMLGIGDHPMMHHRMMYQMMDKMMMDKMIMDNFTVNNSMKDNSLMMTPNGFMMNYFRMNHRMINNSAMGNSMMDNSCYIIQW